MNQLNSVITVIFLCFFITSNHLNAQELQPGDVLPELTPEERAERGAGNTLALAEVYILYAQEQGQSIAEAGRNAGEHFAGSWPEGLTPEGFVTGMHNNWQMYGVGTEILDVDEDHIRARRSRIATEEAFDQAFTISLSDIETFFEYVQKGISSAHGLTYSEEHDGDYIVFTVSGSL